MASEKCPNTGSDAITFEDLIPCCEQLFEGSEYSVEECSKDLMMSLRLTWEYWQYFPQVQYHSMWLPGAMETEHTGDFQDNYPATSVDDLWGEPHPPGQLPGIEWENPHSTERLDATEGDQRKCVGLIYVQIDHEPKERMLQRWGIDAKRRAMVTFFRPLMIHAGLDRVREGDRFLWKEHVYECVSYNDPSPGYWLNTSIQLFTRAVFKYGRYGS